MGTGSLAGLRVIEMGAFIAGPFCGQMLADHGADVIKIEPPRHGDAMRQWGSVKKDGKSLWWPVIARNKKSVTLDLRDPRGVAIARRLLDEADVLVENFRPGKLEEWGLSPEELAASNPRLIIARVSGFGQSGPYASRVGFGAIAEAMAGLRHIGGFPDSPRPRIGLSIGDSLAGLMATVGVLAALQARASTGRGQVVDVAITDSVLSVMESIVSEFSATGAVRQPTGTSLPKIAPSNIYPTADDRWCLIAANADGIFRRLADAMSMPELASDPRFATHDARGDRQDELDGIIAEWTRSFELEALVALLEARSVPAAAIATAADVAENPHFLARGAIVPVDAGALGELRMQAVAPKLSGTPGEIRWAGPELGRHTDDVLAEELDLSASEIAALRGARVI